jgi:uncharacterized integral membrane protein
MIILIRLMAIVFLMIALAILAASNPVPSLHLVFLGRQTVEIPLGILGLGAMGTGLLAGLGLRVALWSYAASRGKKTDRKSDRLKNRPEPEFFDQPLAPEFRADESPTDAAENRFDNYSRPSPRPTTKGEPEPGKDNNVVRDANYRVISSPQPPPEVRPQVESTLKPDNQDWGFDFDDEE